MPVTKIQPSGVNTQASFSFANVAVTANLTTSGTLEATGNVALSGANVSLGNVANLKLSGANANTVLSVSSTGNISASLITQENIAAATLDVISGVKVSSIGYPGNDTAADIAGGQTITLTGVGFKAGATVIINGASAPVVTVVSSTSITFTAPAQNAGTYPLYVINTDGATAIAVPGISYSGVPNWSTSAGSLGNVYETTAINNTVTATGDAPVTYSLQSGALPTGASLNSANGLISGTSVATGSPTTYTFTIRASDAQNQDTDRQFSLTINPDVVTWSSPANNATLNANVNAVLSNVTMSATSAAGYNITYTADTLPTGLSISGANITGTPTVVANTTTTLTATAATTNRTATRTINWVISVSNDTYWNYTTTLLNAETVTPNVWNDDASTNKFAITVNGDTKPVAFSPYNNDFSVKFDGSNDYISVPAGTDFSFGTGDFTIECFINTTDNSLGPGGYSRSIMRIGDFDFYLRINQYHGGTDGALVVAGLSDGSTVSLKDGAWHHVALVRQSNTIRLWIDGIYQTSGSGTSYTTNHSNADLNTIGCRSNPIAGNFNGYITNVRVVKGTAVYTGTSNFTVPTAPLTAVANTVLLACARNRFIDANVTPKTITVNDAPVISGWTPLIETDTTTGSGYFDGVSDYLRKSGTGVLTANNDVTIECWIYPFSTTVIGLFDGGPNEAGILRNFGNNKIAKVAQESTGASFTVTPNIWQHFACTASAGNIKVFINGSLNGTGTYTDGYAAGLNFDIGTINAGGDGSFSGYISDFRVTNSVLYTTTFTPPTSTLTPVANTRLLTLQYRTGENNNRFVDSSGLNNIITRFNNSTQGTFSPYSLTGWSNYSDGSGDYLTWPGTTLSGDFTVECWVYKTAVNASGYTIVFGGAGNQQFAIDNTTAGSISLVLNGAGVIGASGTAVTSNVWHHLAWVRQGSTCRAYVNGVQRGTGTSSASAAISFIGQYDQGGYGLTGYISNVRIVAGTCLYPGGTTFTPSTSPLTAIANTSLLTCQSNRLIDNSVNNFTITRNGDVSVQSFSPFAPAITTPTSYSAYFDGVDDYATFPNNETLAFGTGSFTVEFWINGPLSNDKFILGGRGASSFTITTGGYGGSTVGCLRYQDNVVTSGATLITDNTWHHCAVVRNGSSAVTLYVDGISRGTGTDSTNFSTTSGTWHIARNDLGAGNFLPGYLSNLRILKGIALYTANFTPPTSPLTAIANTSLLTCQSSRFIDNSTNRFTITVNGDAAPRSFNPFGNTVTSDVTYSITTVGGSVLLDGTGDYLYTPHSAQLVYGTSNFTIDFWIYVNAYGNPSRIFQKGVNNNGYSMDMSSSGNLSYNNNSGLAGSNTTIAVPLKAWTHVALVRSGTGTNQTRWYINGQSAGTWTYSVSVSEADPLYIGGAGGVYNVNGYICDFRFVYGSAEYTGPFAPPVAPAAAVANTTLLLSGTNGGVIDYTGKNNLETVGNARTSTAIVKYSNRSLVFTTGNGSHYLKMPLTSNLQFAAGENFTIECWIYLNANAAGICAVWSNYNSFGSGTLSLFAGHGSSNSNLFIIAHNGTFPALSSTTTVNSRIGLWTHLAVVRNSDNYIRLYINGSSEGSPILSTVALPGVGPTFWVATTGDSTTGNPDMYVDDFRITKGYARYTANFTPPSGAFITK